MSKKQIKAIVILGVVCAVLLAAGVVYSLLFNDGRWVAEMDLTNYVFSVKDIPMLAVGALIVAYAVGVAAMSLRAALLRKRSEPRYTRRVPPLLGALGVCGLLGFTGIWTYSRYGILSPFLLFALLGLFGLFFEGKLSHTLKDELFLQNKARADLNAYKTGFVLLVAVILLSRWHVFARNAEWCAVFLLISVSLIVALVLFQKSYLLYRYEKEA